MTFAADGITAVIDKSPVRVSYLRDGQPLIEEEHGYFAHDTLRGFRGLPHRTEFVAEHDGVTWYNDSKGTNVGATVAALRGLDRGDESRTVLIAGGDCKAADFSALTPALESCARAVVLIRRDAEAVAAAVPAGLARVQAADMDEAVGRAAELALPGDRVLLSPACATAHPATSQ